MRGIVSSSGADPLEAFALRLRFLGSERLTGEVSALLRGESVFSRDGDLEVAILQVGGPHWMITATLKGADYNCEIALATRTDGDGLGHFEPPPSEPVPEQWYQVLSPTEARWQLVNVAIHSVAPVTV